MDSRDASGAKNVVEILFMDSKIFNLCAVGSNRSTEAQLYVPALGRLVCSTRVLVCKYVVGCVSLYLNPGTFNLSTSRPILQELQGLRQLTKCTRSPHLRR